MIKITDTLILFVLDRFCSIAIVNANDDFDKPQTFFVLFLFQTFHTPIDLSFDISFCVYQIHTED